MIYAGSEIQVPDPNEWRQPVRYREGGKAVVVSRFASNGVVWPVAIFEAVASLP